MNEQSIESVNLIPLHSDLVLIIRAAEEFKDLDEAIVRNFDIILLNTMQGVYRLHQELKESVFGDAGRAQVSLSGLFCRILTAPCLPGPAFTGRSHVTNGAH